MFFLAFLLVRFGSFGLVGKPPYRGPISPILNNICFTYFS